MTYDHPDPRERLAATLADALTQADRLGEVTVGCHLSAAQECLLAQERIWTPADIEAAFAALDRYDADPSSEPRPA